MKKSFIVIILLAVLFLGACAAAFLIYKKGVDEQNKLNESIAHQNEIINQLSAELNELNQTKTVYRLTRNIKSGETLKSEDIEQIEVGIKLTAGYDTELDDLVGMTVMTDMKEGATLYKDAVYPVELRSDYRTLDIICDRQPIGFSKGDTVDVRITFPNGQDFLLLTKKLVNDVYGNCVQVIVDEKDILIYKSAEADWARFYKTEAAAKGTLADPTSVAGTAVQIYCTTYVAAGVQEANKQYYPIQTVLPDGKTFEGSTLWIGLNNYNLTEADLEDWLQVDRLDFEAALAPYDWYRTEMVTWHATYTYQKYDVVTLRNIEVVEEAEFACPRDQKSIDTMVERAFGKRALQQSDVNWVTLEEISSEYNVVDLDTGSNQVNDAKTKRDNMYIAASNAYSERRTAMIQARNEARLAYEQKLAEGLVYEPWDDSMFDSEQWEQDYSSGVLEYLKTLEEQQKAEEESDVGKVEVRYD